MCVRHLHCRCVCVCVLLSQMISAERVMAYSKLDPEASLETLPPHSPPPPNWPDKGSLSLEDVAFRYSDDMPLVLKNLSFSIKPSEKVIPRVSYASPPATSSHTHILPISLHTHLPPHRWASWVARVPVSPPSSLCSSDWRNHLDRSRLMESAQGTSVYMTSVATSPSYPRYWMLAFEPRSGL